MLNVVEAFIHLLYNTEKYIRNSPTFYRSDELRNFLRLFREYRVNCLFERQGKLNSPRYVFSLVGMTNVGKSQLTEALLKFPVTLIENGPTTTIPVEYEYAKRWSMKIYSLKSQKVETHDFTSAVSLGEVLKSKMFEVSAEDSLTTERIVVSGPIELLQDGLVFADTPGFGAAETQKRHDLYRKKLTDYILSYIYEICFCISGANCVVKKEEVEFFNSFKHLCSNIVITKWDTPESERSDEISRYKEKYSHLFPTCNFHFVESKWAVQGHQDNDISKIRASHIDDLFNMIKSRAKPEARQALLLKQFHEAWDDLHELAAAPLRANNINRIPWREDSLLLFRMEVEKAGIKLRGL